MFKHSFFQAKGKRSKEERLSYVRKNIHSDLSPSADYMNYGQDYWDDTESPFGYKGYIYDGRFEDCAKNIFSHCNLRCGSTVLEIGCSRGYLLYEFFRLGCEVQGIDISDYAVSTAHPDIKKFISSLNFLDFESQNSYDIVICKDTLPHVAEKNLPLFFEKILAITHPSSSIIFDVKVANTQRVLELTRQFDPTQITLKTEDFWSNIMEHAFKNRNLYVSFEELF